ncbi:hypothetical protein Ancab_016790 [Ancistrocladus abbreviatus]
MKGTSKMIMGGTLVMVLSLAIVLGLVLVLLAELYCSLLPRRRRLKHCTTTVTTSAAAAAANTSQPQEQPVPSPLSRFYSQGVLHAPRSFLFPKLPSKREQVDNIEKQRFKFHHFLTIQPEEWKAKESPPQPLLTASPSPSYIPLCQPGPSTNSSMLEEQEGGKAHGHHDQLCHGGCSKEQLVYISNPIYDNDATGRLGKVEATPFETPDTSPSRLETGGSSGEEERAKLSPCSPSSAMTPPLTPMKELPAKACSIALRDANSLATSGSDSNATSSSSGSPCTSPSW